MIQCEAQAKETGDYDQRMSGQQQHPGVDEKGNSALEAPSQIEADSGEDSELTALISESESDGEERRVPRIDLRRARTPEVSSSEWSSDSDDEEGRIPKGELEADEAYMSQAFVARKEAGARETRRLLGRMWALEDFQTGRGLLQWIAAKELRAAHEVAEEAWRTYQMRKERMHAERAHPRGRGRREDNGAYEHRMYADWRTRWALTRQQVASAVEWRTAALRRKQAARTLLALGWPCAIQDEATPLAPKPGGIKPRSPALKSEVRKSRIREGGTGGPVPRPREYSETWGTRYSGSKGSRC